MLVYKTLQFISLIFANLHNFIQMKFENPRKIGTTKDYTSDVSNNDPGLSNKLHFLCKNNPIEQYLYLTHHYFKDWINSMICNKDLVLYYRATKPLWNIKCVMKYFKLALLNFECQIPNEYKTKLKKINN